MNQINVNFSNRYEKKTSRFTGQLFFLTVCTAGVLAASPSNGQLYSVYAPGASNPNAWFHDIVTGETVDLSDPGADALATDEFNQRVYFLSENVPGTDGNLFSQQFDLTGKLTSTNLIGFPATSEGRDLSRAESLAFGNGRLYAHNRKIVNDAETGLYEIDLNDATATFLFDPTFDNQSIIIQGMAFNESDDRLYAIALDSLPCSDCSYSVYSIDLVTQQVERILFDVAFADGLAYGDGRLYLVSNTGGAIRVFNLVTGRFEESFANARRFEQGPGGATFAEFLRGEQSPANRKVQIRSVDFEIGIIELFNFERVGVDLSGWRFCTHDFDEAFRYTSATGLDTIVIQSNSSLYIHVNNDAPDDDSKRINLADLGGAFSLPLDQNAFSLQLFFPDENGDIQFGNSSLIADHIQWKIEGTAVGLAQSRSAQAVSEGLWSGMDDFIITDGSSASVQLTDFSGDQFGEPEEYQVLDAKTEFGIGDLNCDATVNLLDVDPFIIAVLDPNAFEEIFPECDPNLADINQDGAVNLLDVEPFVRLVLRD